MNSQIIPLMVKKRNPAMPIFLIHSFILNATLDYNNGLYIYKPCFNLKFNVQMYLKPLIFS